MKLKLWKDKGKNWNAFGLTNIFGVVNSKYVISFRVLGYSFGYSKDLKKFI